jgi:hypothetical protein
MKNVLLWLLLSGCASSNVARETARSVVLTVAEAAKVADSTCARLALSTFALDESKRERAKALAVTCADAYDVARPAIIAAAEGVDAWDSGSRKGVVCGLAKASPALLSMAGAIRAAGGKLPLVVEDGLRMINALGGCQ